MDYLKKTLLWGMFFLIIFGIYKLIPNSDLTYKPPYSVFMENLASDNVREVKIQGQKISVHLRDGSFYQVFAPNDPELINILWKKGVRINATPVTMIDKIVRDSSIFFLALLVLVLGFIEALILIKLHAQGYFTNKDRGTGFGKSKAILQEEDQIKVTLDDVGGLEDVKEKVKLIIDALKDPGKYQKVGGEIPKGILLVGPSGTGKTLLARAVAGEAKVPFFTIAGSDFVEMFIGVGASRVRDMFEQARKHAPCIIFIDELDAVGKHRISSNSDNDERNQTLYQLLVELDGFEGNEGVIVFAATNRLDLIDPALLRSRRFDYQVLIPNIDARAREMILKVHMKKHPTDDDVNIVDIANNTQGYTGADIYTLVNNAALIAARHNKRLIHMSHFWMAISESYLTPSILENQLLKRTQSSNKSIARESIYIAGRIIAAWHLKILDMNSMVRIGSLMKCEVVYPTPPVVAKNEIEDRIALALAGRAAEHLYNKTYSITVIGEKDFKYATNLAEQYVKSWGFSDIQKLRTLSYGSKNGALSDDVPPESLRKVEREIADLLEQELSRAEMILSKDQKGLEIIAETLTKYGSLYGQMIPTLLTEGMTESLRESLEKLSN